MKAEELMIGDLILMNGSMVKVTKLSKNGEYDNCEGIPLAPDILEKNFNKYIDSFSVFTIRKYNNRQTPIWIQITSSRAIKDTYIVEIEVDKKGTLLYSDEVQFVHELQHLLKDAHLYELAENFKIE